MPKETILAIDDEEDILELVRYNLTREGFQVTCSSSGEEALKIATDDRPELIILDLMLPGIDGLEVMRRLKNSTSTQSIPVIMLTAKSEEADIVTGLELGADDYVTKPFSPRILSARVKAVLRRKAPETGEGEKIIRIHGIEINPVRRLVIVDGKTIDLTFTEFEILNYLARRPGWVFTRTQIMDSIRGEDYFVTDRSVDVQIAGLRKKLESAGSCIETVRGVGYRFKE